MMAGGVESITGLSRGTAGEFDENPRLLAEKPDIEDRNYKPHFSKIGYVW